ncbi:V-type proton ATPase subunit G-like protein [Hapsidospora chrysogenum ATCC 11550]|uniref:V-type proton ATPase subunit G n=1 Tax=Hapsidospora chrysogenum (strain ATCC 11550 / CBS 779.69 / DSM 880 / IAM 14645 / JCM 23072 / IMI 49137) TaxID=857340 RepID=A0A086SWK9_HAPC1|nr:V-type proton ATPase subunit G-like protein [Hapsidospora chrysogenum ATCC 11550]
MVPSNAACPPRLRANTDDELPVCAELGGHPDPARFRTQRVKEARDEAKKEIAEYKAKKDEEYKKFEAEHSKGNQQAEDEANKEAEKQIQSIKEAGKKGQADVVKNLLAAVLEAKPNAVSS